MTRINRDLSKRPGILAIIGRVMDGNGPPFTIGIVTGKNEQS